MGESHVSQISVNDFRLLVKKKEATPVITSLAT